MEKELQQDEKFLEYLGLKVVEWFDVPQLENKRFATRYGSKTLIGLGAVLERIIKEAELEFNTK